MLKDVGEVEAFTLYDLARLNMDGAGASSQYHRSPATATNRPTGLPDAGDGPGAFVTVR